MKLKALIAIYIFNFKTFLFSAEAGMPQLDSKYWFSQSFWLVLIFSILYLVLSKFFIPKIKDNLDNREKKIRENLEEAKEFSEQANKKILQYEKEISNAKKDVIKILSDSKKQIEKNLNKKKEQFEKELEKELIKAETEIQSFKKNSSENIKRIAEEISAKVIEDIAGEKLNESSIKSSVSEVTKNKINKFI